MSAAFKYPAQDALTVIDGGLTSELGIHRYDDAKRSKAQLFSIGGPFGRQFAIILGDTDVETGRHPAQQTRILLEKCELPAISGVLQTEDAYFGSRIKTQQDSRIAAHNQTSCLVADETALKALLKWYASSKTSLPSANPLLRAKIEKAATDAGFDISPVDDGEWLLFRSTAFEFSLRINTASSAENHFSVQFSDREWGLKTLDDCHVDAHEDEGSWPVAAINLDSYESFYRVLNRAGRTGITLSGNILKRYETEADKLPKTTEAERLVVQRVGQNLFRDALIEYWQGMCAVTGLDVVPLLRASHIKPWSACDTDAERLDVFNGLLLAPHLDALFDGGWISFEDTGELIINPLLSESQQSALGINPEWRVHHLSNMHRRYLAYHRDNVFRAAQ